MTLGRTSKYFLTSFLCGAISFAIFILLYGACFWGGCGNTSSVLIIIAILLVISIIFFIVWLWDILILTFAKKDNEESEETKKIRDIPLSLVSLGLLGNAIYNIYYLERVFEIVGTEGIYAKAIITIFIVIGAIGIWLHRKWGVLVTTIILLVIALPVIWNSITYTRLTHSCLIIGYATAIVILIIKFKDMK